MATRGKEKKRGDLNSMRKWMKKKKSNNRNNCVDEFTVAMEDLSFFNY